MNRYAKRYKNQREYWIFNSSDCLTKENFKYALNCLMIESEQQPFTMIVPPFLKDEAGVMVGNHTKYWLRSKNQTKYKDNFLNK